MALSASEKPRIEESSPREAIMAPPGTPGAAMMVMPSIAIKPANMPKSYGMPWSIIRARAHDTILSVEPDMCMVAQRGTVNPAMSRSTPIATVRSSVTGIVAADDCVPRAVK